MAQAKTPDLSIAAVQTIFQALGPLPPETQQRVLNAVVTLLGISPTSGRSPSIHVPHADAVPSADVSRPMSVVELLKEKNPGSNTQRIATFAYYREKVEGLPRFSRVDLKVYFPRAKLPPDANYDRDFDQTVRHGWIHEDGDDSYLTTKGLETVEAGFGGKALPRGAAALGRARRRKTKRARPTEKTS